MSEKKKSDLNIKQVQSLEQVAFMIARGEDPDAFRSKWERLIIDLVTSNVPIDAGALVQEVIRESYSAIDDDLRSYVEKVRYFNTCKKIIREYIQGLKDIQQQFDAQTATYMDRMRGVNTELLNSIATKEQELRSLDDSSQLAETELQDQSQKVQEFIQTITNIQKGLSDSAREVIKNLK